MSNVGKGKFRQRHSARHILVEDAVAGRSNAGSGEDRQGNIRTATETLFQLPVF